MDISNLKILASCSNYQYILNMIIWADFVLHVIFFSWSPNKLCDFEISFYNHLWWSWHISGQKSKIISAAQVIGSGSIYMYRWPVYLLSILQRHTADLKPQTLSTVAQLNSLVKSGSIFQKKWKTKTSKL